MSEVTSKELIVRITHYLMTGGLFNPELAKHDSVRELLIDCRTALQAGSTHEPCARHSIGELLALLNSEECDHEFRGHSLDDIEIKRFLRWVQDRGASQPPGAWRDVENDPPQGDAVVLTFSGEAYSCEYAYDVNPQDHNMWMAILTPPTKGSDHG